MLAPKQVCGSFSVTSQQGGGGGVDDMLMLPPPAIDYLLWHLRASHTIVGANIAYDFGVVLANVDPDLYQELLLEIFRAYDEDRVWDIQIAEALYAVAQGHLNRNPYTGERVDRYSLDNCVKLVLGRDNAKEHDDWRLRYAELDGLPIEEWPEPARVYPIDDTRNALEVALVQMRRSDDPSIAHNNHDVAAQCRAAWAMHLGAMWGFRVDQAAVNKYEREVEATRATLFGELYALGFLDQDGKRNTTAIKRHIIRSYSDDVPSCAYCQATGFVESEPRVGKRGQLLKTKSVKCLACNGIGLDTTKQNIPMSVTGAVSTARDTLHESGDDDLLKLAAYGETDKAISTYLPFLREAGDTPLALRPNVLLETGRASYSGVIQQFPRSGKERECIVPRDGYVFYSVDYTGLELATHAQSCLWLVGKSALADALNAGRKPHDMLGATLYGKTDAEFAVLYKAGDKRAKALRQAAKPANFGFPGGMGGVKLALNQRMQGPDTTAPDGTKYKGLRFCILMGYAQKCGVKKSTEHLGKPISPTCVECIKAANALREAWFTQWPENRDYFQFIKYKTQDDPNFIKQHVSGRIRGRVDFTSAANGYFQGLAADGAKRALYAVIREQYTDPASVLYGSRTILFAHDELVGEIHRSRMSEGVQRISDIMVEQMRGVCPDVLIEAEPTLMTRWYKQAELMRDEAGNVIPWEPKQ